MSRVESWIGEFGGRGLVTDQTNEDTDVEQNMGGGHSKTLFIREYWTQDQNRQI